jgi:hypothetical protein
VAKRGQFRCNLLLHFATCMFQTIIEDSSLVGYDGGQNVRDEERRVDQEPQLNEQIAGDRLLKTLGIDPNKWTVGDQRIALLGIGIGLAIVIIAVCGYAFGWPWTGLAKRTFWDWLSLLIVPVVLALGGYLFTRSENRRTKDDAERQRAVDREIADKQRGIDREIADERRQDEMLQAYLDGMSQLLTDEKRPLHRSQVGDSLSTVARARTLTVLARLDGERKGSVLRFLYESGLITKDRVVVDLTRADLNGADLAGANLARALLREAILLGARLDGVTLSEADLRGVDLRGADLIGATLSGANLAGTALSGVYLGGAILKGAMLAGAYLKGAEGLTEDQLKQQAASLEGATMPNGQKYEDWLKSREEDGENGGSS